MTPNTADLLLILKRESRMKRVMKTERMLNQEENQVILMTQEIVDVLLTSKRGSRVKGVMMTLGGPDMLQTTDKELRDNTTLKGRKREEIILNFIEHQISLITTEGKRIQRKGGKRGSK
jgi:hypothetical protein